MKKSVFFSVMLVIVMIVSAASAYGQKSKMYSGDKSAKEIKKSQQIFSEQIDNLKNNIKDLEKSKIRVISRYQRTTDEYYGNQIIQIDSLINLYQQKVMLLEDQQITFVVTTASKDQQSYVDLQGRNPTELANAYVIVKYAENYKNAANTVKTASNNSKLVGIIENAGYVNSVVVKITGPANFHIEFTLNSKQKSPEFYLPCPGIYTAVFTNGYQTRSVTKTVGPNIVYYDDNKPVDFKATLLP